MTRRFTGRHMAAILVTFFGIVFAVNFVMAGYAHSTFGGIVVENSYVASQKFNGWLEEARAQERLGWSAGIKRDDDGSVRVMLDGPGPQARLAAIARHPLGRAPDRELTFVRAADGSFVSRETLPAGRWTMRLEVRDGDDIWRSEDHLT
jgi:nitrogen fixation protein FixH